MYRRLEPRTKCKRKTKQRHQNAGNKLFNLGGGDRSYRKGRTRQTKTAREQSKIKESKSTNQSHTHTHKSNKDQKHKHICTSITKRVGLTMGKGRGLNRHKGGDGKQTQVKIINYLNYYYHEP